MQITNFQYKDCKLANWFLYDVVLICEQMTMRCQLNIKCSAFKNWVLSLTDIVNTSIYKYNVMLTILLKCFPRDHQEFIMPLATHSAESC